LVVVALSFSLGTPWAWLQAVAWAGMLINYSLADGLVTAVSKTFDGKHPCPLCHLVAKGKKAEQQQKKHAPPTSKMLDLFLQLPLNFSCAETVAARVRAADETACARFERPPFPPPRTG
jgi:hypothetical protein